MGKNVDTVLKVSGMSCGHCKKAVEEGVGAIEGVVSVLVDIDEGEVKITFDNSKVQLEKIQTTIEDLGYDIKD